MGRVLAAVVVAVALAVAFWAEATAKRRATVRARALFI